MSSVKPSLDLLRSLTEEHILRAIMDEGRLTRAEISARTGISKPTISEGVRRLVEADLIFDTGEVTSGRGRAGNYYNLSVEIGVGLVIMIAPAGVTAQTVNAFGMVTGQSTVELDPTPGKEGAARALTKAVRTALAKGTGPIRTTVISAADPVDRATGRLVQLPDAPFMVGELDPPALLAPLVTGPVLVDNDVNWAARAERAAAELEDPDNFVYLHLGRGLGAALVSDGTVSRGHRGLAGEIAHTITVGPAGRARRFTDIFAELDLRHPDSTAIDVPRVRACLDDGADPTRDQLARAVAGVVGAAIALGDPSAVIVGGDWGRHPAFLAALQKQLEDAPRKLTIRSTVLQDRPELIGARDECLEALRSDIIGSLPRHH